MGLLAGVCHAADPTTPRVGLVLQPFGEQNWDVGIRNNFSIIDSSMCVPTLSNTFTQPQTISGGNSLTMMGGGTIYEVSGDIAHSSSIQNLGILGHRNEMTISSQDGLFINGNSFYPSADLNISGGTGHIYGSFAVIGSSQNTTIAYSGFTATSPISASTLWSLPKGDGANGQVMGTDGAAHLGWYNTGSGGASGASLLAVNQNSVQITSPTIAINALSPPFIITSVGGGTTAQWTLSSSSVTLNGPILTQSNVWSGFNNVSGSTTFSGNLNISSGILILGGAGTNGQVLTSGGSGTVPSWGSKNIGLPLPVGDTNYIQNTTLLQSATFYTSSGTANSLNSNLVFVTSNIYVNTFGSPAIAQCTELGVTALQGTTCPLGDPGANASIGHMIFMGDTGSSGANAYGVYSDVNELTTGGTGSTYGGFFYAARSNNNNYGVYGTAGEASGSSASNYAIYGHGLSESAGTTGYGVYGTANEVVGGSTYGGYFIDNDTNGTAVGLYAAGHTHGFILGGGDFETNNSVGVSGNLLSSQGSGSSPQWYDLIDSSPTWTGQASWTSAKPSTFTALAVSGLTSGQCVQTGTGGLLTGTGSACGTGSGGTSAPVALPNLIFYSTISVLLDTNTMTTNTSSITFRDGTTRAETSVPAIFGSTRVCNINQTGNWGLVPQSGLTPGYVLTTNTWYQYYAVESSQTSTDFSCIIDTVSPATSAGVSYLNTTYGFNKWAHLGLLPYGNNNDVDTQITSFVQRGSLVSFNAIIGGNNGGRLPGVVISSTTGTAATLTWTWAISSALNSGLPDNMQVSVNFGFAGSSNASDMIVADKPGAGYIALLPHNEGGRSVVFESWLSGQGIGGGILLATDGANRNYTITVIQYFIDDLLGANHYALQ